MKAFDKIRETADLLEMAGIESPVREAEICVRLGLGISGVDLYRDNPDISREHQESVDGMIERRVKGEPLQYILGYEEFLDLRLEVGPGVLIPRPETEFMADHVIRQLRAEGSRFTVLDVCTGSGCLALALAKELPHAQVYGSDISETAIEYAKKNAKANSIENVKFLTGSLLEPPERLSALIGQPLKFDVVVSNPPYIRRDDIQLLQREIREWEPRIALDGGRDGLEFYRKLIPGAREHLRENGRIILELGEGQAESVAAILANAGYRRIETMKDLAGRKRIVQARWKK